MHPTPMEQCRFCRRDHPIEDIERCEYCHYEQCFRCVRLCILCGATYCRECGSSEVCTECRPEPPL